MEGFEEQSENKDEVKPGLRSDESHIQGLKLGVRERESGREWLGVVLDGVKDTMLCRNSRSLSHKWFDQSSRAGP